MAGKRSRQSAYEIFSIKRRFQQFKLRPLDKFKESFARRYQIWVCFQHARSLPLSNYV